MFEIMEAIAVRSPPLVRRRRLDGRTKRAKRIRALIAEYSARLGVGADRERIERTAELVQISRDLREQQLNGEVVDMHVLLKAENTAARALRVLGLDQKPKGTPLPSKPLHEMIREAEARRAAAEASA